LGGTETGRTLCLNGTIPNGQVRIGDSTVMVSEATDDHYRAIRSAFYLDLENVDASMQ